MIIHKLKNLLGSKKKNPSKLYKKSYSQSGEDLIIDTIFEQFEITTPSYIDIGAHHPYSLSNTAYFHAKGSRGINVEPDPELFAEFLKFRNNDINLNIGISTENGILDFYLMNSKVLNTFSVEQVKLYESEGDYKVIAIKPIIVENINYVLDKYYGGVFPDFLSLDAEGLDEIVLLEINYKNAPKVICVETLSFSTSGLGIKDKKIINFLIKKGYFLYADTYINSIFVLEKWWRGGA